MGTQTIRPARDKTDKEQKPKSEPVPPSADVPEDKTKMESPPKSWPD
jgi:hypothetical protein